MGTTLGTIPDISCFSGGVGEELCRRLQGKFQELSLSNNQIKERIKNDDSRSFETCSSHLIVLDRTVDVAAMFRHPSTYQALVGELFEQKGSRILIPTEGNAKNFALSLNKETDSFWQIQSNSVFPRVIEAAEKERQRLLSKELELKKKAAEISADKSVLLKRTVVNLEKFEEEKRLINMHFKILESSMSQISKRDIPTFFEIEEQLKSNNNVLNFSEVHSILSSKLGTDLDRIRLLSSWVLSNSFDPKEAKAPDDFWRDYFKDSKLVTIDSLQKLFSLLVNLRVSGRGSANSSKYKKKFADDSSVLKAAAWASSIFKEGSKLIDKLMPNENETNVITRLCERLLRSIGTEFAIDDDDICHFDLPRNPSIEYSHTKAPEKVIIFVVGGSNCSEFQELQKFFHSQYPQVELIFGTTDVVNGNKFMSQFLR